MANAAPAGTAAVSVQVPLLSGKGLVDVPRESYVRRMGKERSRVLALRAEDPVMAVLGPIGLAASAGTSLIVDFGDRLGRAGGRTLADLLEEGPRLDELSPGRAGVALIRGGGLSSEEGWSVVERLSGHWPAVVVHGAAPRWPGPTVPVEILFPGWLTPAGSGPAVWQSLGDRTSPPGPGPVLPRLGQSQVRRILSGRLPGRGRWLRVWERVWELPWA